MGKIVIEGDIAALCGCGGPRGARRIVVRQGESTEAGEDAVGGAKGEQANDELSSALRELADALDRAAERGVRVDPGRDDDGAVDACCRIVVTNAGGETSCEVHLEGEEIR